MNDEFDTLRAATPARLGVGRAGARYTTRAQLEFRADHARAVDAVLNEVPVDWARKNRIEEFRSRAKSREEYLRFPERGRRLADGEASRPSPWNRDLTSRRGTSGDGISVGANVRTT